MSRVLVIEILRLGHSTTESRRWGGGLEWVGIVEQGHSPAVQYSGYDWIIDVQFGKPLRVQLSDDQVPFQHVLGHGDTEFFRSQKPQQERRV